MKEYDVIIIGSGPAGIIAAAALAAQNMKVLIVEKGRELIRRKSPINGWFGQGLYSMSRLRLNDPALNNADAFGKMLVILEEILSWEADKGRNYVSPPPECAFRLAGYFFNTVVPKTDVIFEADVFSVKKIKREFEVITQRGAFRSKRCIVATGSASYSWVKKLCEVFKIQHSKRTAKVGVRVEISNNMNKLDIGDNVMTEDKEILCDDICSHAFVTEWEDSDIVSAKGYIVPGKLSDKTNFMMGFKPKLDTEEIIRTIKIVNVLANDRIKKEPVKEFMEDRSILQHLDLFEGFKEKFELMQEKVPLIIDYGAMYIPEIKLSGILPVSDKMRTKVAKLYGAGECTTRVSTLIGAMASGLIVANTIMEE